MILRLKTLLCNLLFNKAIIISFIIGVCVNSFSQDKIEIGGMVGTSYYLGDLNHQKQFYKPSLAFGGIARYVLSDRMALKGTAIIDRLKGEYPNNGIVFPEGDVKYSFSRTIGDAALQAEFNFMSYDHPFVRTTNFTPFISFGLGTTVYKRFDADPTKNSQQTVFILSLPFGVGFKYKINDWIRVGVEWSFRKTFVDDLDYMERINQINPYDPYGFENTQKIHNTDMYSFAGVMVTFSMFKRKTECNSGY